VALDVRHIRAETENRVTFAYVSFTHQPDDVSEIERVLGCEVRTGASWAGLALPIEAWQLPLRRRDPILRGVLERQADAITPPVPAMDGLALDIRRVLASRVTRGEMEIEGVARDLGMSSRTLQRRLSVAGLSYQELLDMFRRETAEKCIADRSLSIGEVAYLVGYSEPAAFHRAFKRWTGVTPQAFRQQQRRNQGIVLTTAAS
jgi:AraC-like DNA-binding protein